MLNEERLLLIHKAVFSHVKAFVKTRSLQPRHLVSAGLKPGLLHPVIRDFADFVVLHELQNCWGQSGLASRREAELLPLFQQLSVREISPKPSSNQHPTGPPQSGHGVPVGAKLLGFPSWLYATGMDSKSNQMHDGLYACVFDDDFIFDRSSEVGHNAEFLRIRLYYHELGHFVLHRDRLLPISHRTPPTVTGPANESSKEEELEAWVFASSIIGLAVGDHAFAQRMAKKPDDAWLLS